MPSSTQRRRQAGAAERALARSALYRLLSQALAYPAAETVAELAGSDLPRARQAAARLPPSLGTLLAELDRHLQGTDAEWLQAEHRRIFSHIISLDCPPCETIYTARHVFQETQDLSDIAGFFRAFGLELAEKERLDHISVELEFMHFLAYKEAYALTHHGPARARLCREVQRKFMQDHLGRWAGQFSQRLARKAEGGYYGCIAALLEGFIAAEVRFLRARPEPVSVDPRWRTMSADDFNCPMAERCLL